MNKNLKRHLLLHSLLILFMLTAWGLVPVEASQVRIKTLENKHYQLLVDEEPYFVKGVCYNPVPIGDAYEYDLGEDKDKPWILDGKLMQEGGINTIRLYKASSNPESLKQAMKDLYEDYGIRTMLGHWLGFWEYPYPRYADPDFRERIKEQVLDMVRTYKDEESLLFWVLGNENNYSFSGRVNAWKCKETEGVEASEAVNIRAKIYYSFVNDIAREIHKIDPDHPVVLGNGEALYLDIASEVSPDIDVIGVLIYRGRTFGNLFDRVREVFDLPLLLIEFGADAYNSFEEKEDQEMQAFFLESQWRDIYLNAAGSNQGAGNCLGGTTFEWTDEWWKHNESSRSSWVIHDRAAGWSNGSYYLDIKAPGNQNMNEEWFGIAALDREKENGLNKRLLRSSYYAIKEFWQDPYEKLKTPLVAPVEKITREPVRGIKIWE